MRADEKRLREQLELKKENAFLRKEQTRLEDEAKTLRALLEEQRDQWVAVVRSERESVGRLRLVVRALGEIANAADATLDMRNFASVRSMLSIARGVYVSSLRDQVAHEPGGVAYVPSDPIATTHPAENTGEK